MSLEILDIKARDIILADQGGINRYLGQALKPLMKSTMEYWKKQKALITAEQMKTAINIATIPSELRTSLEAETRLFVMEDMCKAWEKAIESSGGKIAARINTLPKKDFRFSSNWENIRRWLTTHAAELIVEISDKQFKSIQALLHDQIIIQGTTSPYILAQRIRPIVGLTERWAKAVENRRLLLIEEGISAGRAQEIADKYAEFLHHVRAENISRTELSNSYHEGQLRTVAQASAEGELPGPVEKTWMTNFVEGRTCEECEAMDGETVGVDEIFSGGVDRPPLHPDCLLGNTPVLIPEPKIAFVIPYKGPLIKIMFIGGDITVTPNHMFLTSEGFARASSLRKGDKIFYSLFFERIIFRNPNNDRKPATIKQIITTLSKSKNMIARTVPVAPEYFHGDGTFMNGDVDIIASNGFSQGDLKSKSMESNGEISFSKADMAQFFFFCERNLGSMLLRMRDATDGGMGSRSEADSFSGREPLHSKFISFTYASDFNSSPNKPLSNCTPINRKALRNLLFRFSSEITLRDVLDVKVIFPSHYSIPIYDVETSTSLYIGNGLVSSNCRCDLGYRVKR